MENQIWRSVDYEGDIWCEKAIVFPKDKNREEYFTKENMIKLLNMTEDEQKYYDYYNIRFDTYTIYVIIAKTLGDGDMFNYNENDMYCNYKFVEMGGVTIYN